MRGFAHPATRPPAVVRRRAELARHKLKGVEHMRFRLNGSARMPSADSGQQGTGLLAGARSILTSPRRRLLLGIPLALAVILAVLVPVLAVHDLGIFQVDGNAQVAALLPGAGGLLYTGDDWDN